MPPKGSYGALCSKFPSDNAAKQFRADKKKLTVLLKDGDSTPIGINVQLSRLRSFCGALVFEDSQSTAELNVEEVLWNLHSQANDWYKNCFKHLRRQKKHVEERKMSKRYLDFVKTGQRYYRNYIHKLATHASGGIPELEAVALGISVKALGSKDAGNGRGTPQPTLNSYFQALLRLGDLCRWREQRRPVEDRNWASATGFYDLASTIRPDSGLPYNQLAVIAASTKQGSLRAIYYFFRALTAREPHPHAEANLDIEFKKVMARPQRQLSFSQSGATSLEEDQLLNEVAGSFLWLHGELRTHHTVNDLEQMDRCVIGYLCTSIKSSPNSGAVAMDIILINILAEYSARQKLDDAKRKDNDLTKYPHLVRARAYFFKFNVRVFTALLELLHDNVVEYSEWFHLTCVSADQKITPVMRRVLPCVRIYSSWVMTIVHHMVKQYEFYDEFFQALRSDLRRFWASYVETLTILVQQFGPDDVLDVGYLLEEDSETIGFAPFQYGSLMHRFLEEGNFRKRDRYNALRQSLAKEMLSRIRDLVIDAAVLADDGGVPITAQLRNDQFVFVFELPLALEFTPPRTARPARSRLSSGSERSATPTPGKTRPVSSPGSIVGKYWNMVDNLVGPETTPQASKYNWSTFQTREPETVPRTSTPPAYSFEDPDFDIDPFSEDDKQDEGNTVYSHLARLKDSLEAGKVYGKKGVGDQYYRVRMPF